MKKRMKMAAVMAAVMGMMTLGGCGTVAKRVRQLLRQRARMRNRPRKMEKVRSCEINVVLDWYPNAVHTFIYTAIERGYYAEEGLDVKVRFPR